MAAIVWAKGERLRVTSVSVKDGILFLPDLCRFVATVRIVAFKPMHVGVKPCMQWCAPFTHGQVYDSSVLCIASVHVDVWCSYPRRIELYARCVKYMHSAGQAAEDYSCTMYRTRNPEPCLVFC